MRSRLLLFCMVALATLFGEKPLFAQNTIVNGDFEQGYTGFDTEYSVDTDQIGEGCYCIDYTTSGHAGGVPWYPVLGYGGSGMYMLVNGFGNSSPTPKIVWKQTVNVTSQTTYTFSCQLANMSQGVVILDPLPAIIQLKIRVNGTATDVGASMTLDPSGYQWQAMTRTWNSGNYSGPVDVEIYDLYQGLPGLGDDFGLDHISFVPDEVYTAYANDDQAGSVCLNASIDIDVLANDMLQPNANDAVVTIIENPAHGSAIPLGNNQIRYSYDDASYTGTTDQFRYRVSNHGATSEAWVTVTLTMLPTVGSIILPDGICAGESFELTVPEINDNGANIISQGWEIAPTVTGQFAPLDNNGIPFSYNGYYLRYAAANDCGPGYSDAVQVVVYSTEPTFDTIMACDTYPWNGLICDHSDDYSTQVTTEDGCEITAHLHFILNEDYFTESETESACFEYFWPRTGLTYSVSGIYNDTVENPNPMECDSIYTLYLTINSSPEVLGNIDMPSEICSGDTLWTTPPQYAFNHADGGTFQWEYALAPVGPFTPFNPESNNFTFGDYFLRFVVFNGCGIDSSNVVPLRVNAAPIVQGQLSNFQVCVGETLPLPTLDVTWNNVDENDRFTQWQMSQDGENFYAFNPSTSMQLTHDGCWVRYKAANSCGEGYLGPVRVSVISVEDQYLPTIQACDEYMLPSGEVITQSQVIQHEESEPCFHIVYQPIEINHSDSSVETITSCHDDFVWHEQHFFRSDETQIAYWDTVNRFGCDSVVELRLDFGDYAVITEYRTACNDYVWPRKPHVSYTESQLDSVFIPSYDDQVCDSMIYLVLTLGHDVEMVGDPWTECAGFEWNGQIYTADDTVYEYLQTEGTRCDSIVSHQLTIVQPVETSFYRTNCQVMWWEEHTCDHAGDYVHVYQTQQGCDSIVTMHFSFSEEIQVHVDTTTCQAFSWYGNWCDTDGATYSHTFVNPDYCDSTVFLHLTMGKPYIGQQFRTVCDSVTLFGVFYGPGNYLIPLDPVVGQNGCDSIVTINLVVQTMDGVAEIQGESNVYVATNLISGIYSYSIDSEEIIGNIQWRLSRPDWTIVDQDAKSCRVLVTSVGHATLTAVFRMECGEVERTIDIQSGFFDLDDYQTVAAKVFPNPTKGAMTVEAEGIESVRVIDMLGQTRLEEQFSGADSATIQLQSLPSSVYLLEIQTKNGRTMLRIVLCK